MTLVWNYMAGIAYRNVLHRDVSLLLFTTVCTSASPDVTIVVQLLSWDHVFLYIGSVNTRDLFLLNSVINYVYPLHPYQQNLHLKSKMKWPIPQANKYSLVHNIDKSQTKLQTTKTSKTVKIWLLFCCSVSP